MCLRPSLWPINRLYPHFFIASISWLLFFQYAFVSVAFAQQCSYNDFASQSCVSSDDPGLASSQDAQYRQVGNPVDVITGSKQQHELDFQAVGSPLHFSRYYHSGQTEVNLSLGQGWRHSYLVKLYDTGDGHRRIQQADGRWIDFDFAMKKAGSSLFHTEFESDGYLIDNGATVWKLPDGRELYFHGSYLIRIEYPHGRNLQLFYKNKKLASVSDKQGRQLLFEYTQTQQGLTSYEDAQAGRAGGHLESVVLPSGQRLNYRYDHNQNLVNANYAQDQSSQYEFVLQAYPNHLSSINEISGSRYDKRTWTYDSFGRVTGFEHPVQNISMSLRYENDDELINGGETFVEFGHGRQEQYRWMRESDQAAPFVNDVKVRDCPDCKQLQFQPVPRKMQVLDEVIAQEWDRPVAITRKGAKAMTASTSTSYGAYPEYHDLIPEPLSFNQRTELILDGQSYSFLIDVSREGEVLDISVGSTSLHELRAKWRSGNMERCYVQPLLQRSLIYPAPQTACLEDLLYLMELSSHIEKLSRDQGLNQDSWQGRSGTSANACLSNPFQSCDELERDYELAQLSSCAYRDVLQECGDGWKPVTPSSLGLADDLFSDGSFASTLFLNPETNEYVLAFRGTNDLADWRDNILQAGGESTRQYRAAVALAQALDQALPDASLEFTGHSLGGGLATAAALSIEANATVFNPAALHVDAAAALGLDYSLADTLVNVTTVDGDVLTALQHPTKYEYDDLASVGRFVAPGEHTMIGAPSTEWVDEQKKELPFFARSDGIVLHSIAAVLESEEKMLIELCDIEPVKA